MIRRYEEEYGGAGGRGRGAGSLPQRIDLNQTSFLLTSAGVAAGGGGQAGHSGPPAGIRVAGCGGGLGSAGGTPRSDAGGLPPGGTPVPERPLLLGPVRRRRPGPADEVPASGTPWAGTDTNAAPGGGASVPLPATVYAPQLTGFDEEDLPPSGAAAGGRHRAAARRQPAAVDRGGPGGEQPGAAAAAVRTARCPQQRWFR